ncbi:uncharacterized protein VTP21DRAFT_4881 [Calcarisporiella thermophila]|uniref:uncharacterized protein n=1 Tax=Calcarisporiella thermophila TaxID=911321 RepID=UPI00374435E3
MWLSPVRAALRATSSRLRQPRANPAIFRNYITRTTSAATWVEGSKHGLRAYSTQANAETANGQPMQHEFKAETKKLLQIVTNSLYSEKEVFVRELVSNAADALEKLRHAQLTQQGLDSSRPLEIRISVDKEAKTFTIQDSGVGMTEEELIDNLGTIARSGSKSFLEKLESSEASAKDKIIGQFGVGFYSSFMVGANIRVYTRSATPGSKGYVWASDGLGSYTVSEADGVDVGTKIVIELREDCMEFADKLRIESIVKKYSNFVGFPIYLNEERVNTLDALWTKAKNEVTADEHRQFYQFISQQWDSPLYTLHFKSDFPAISSILYVPERHMEVLGTGFGRQEPGVSLYTRKVLIQSKSKGLLPEWLRFLRGVVDAEDLPLNVSRELLQDGVLQKLSRVLTRRIVSWLEGEAKQDPKKYADFVGDFGVFLKEGVCTDPVNQKDIAKLLRYETSTLNKGELSGLKDYVERMKEGQKSIYYLCTSARKFAEESAYLEKFKEKGVEVLFLYDNVDEFVVNHLRDFNGHKLVSIDSDISQDEFMNAASESNKGAEGLSEEQGQELAEWLQNTLGKEAVKKVTVSRRLVTHPAIVTDHDSPAMRRMLAMMSGSAKNTDDLPPSPVALEINGEHAVIRGLYRVRNEDPELAKLVASQIHDNALCAAGVLDDPRSMITRLNRLLELTLEKRGIEEKKA